MRFIGVIDENGKKTPNATKVFSLHDDAAFQEALSSLVKKGYSQLFDLHGDMSWELDSNSLITFFRQHDQTSAITGKRQAVTFEALLSLCGHKDMPNVRGSTKVNTKPKAKKAATPKPAVKNQRLKMLPQLAWQTLTLRAMIIILALQFELRSTYQQMGIKKHMIEYSEAPKRIC